MFYKDSDRNRVLGNLEEEMARRLALGEKGKRKAVVGSIVAFLLIGFGLWPLGIWRMGAVIAGLMLAYWIYEEPVERLADEIDLLEEKIVARFTEPSAQQR